MKIWNKLLPAKLYILLLVGFTVVFFYPVFLSKKIPIPADTIVGMYHPWRDNVWNNFTSGVPFKNFLITDPVRQQYVWRKLAIDNLKKMQLPLWNPYSFSGTPLLANFQSAPFYPLNILFFILPFNIAWTILVILQPLLAGIFLYMYLRYMKVSPAGSFLGAFTFAFSGFSIAWLEWNTVIQTALWLPLILLAKENLLKKVTSKWVIILFFAEISSFLAGHLQILFYTLIISNVYLFVRIIQLTSNRQKENIITASLRKYIPFLLIGSAVLLVTSIQWLPTLRFILQSSRDFDQGSWMRDGWFIPWQNFIQFIAPDFFGNPATGNYWGIWNYAEFIGFIGIAPLILAFYCLFFRRDKKTLFFGSFTILAILFAFPTPLAKLPFILKIPFIATSQPTRLMYVIDLSLSVLAALGFDKFIKDSKVKNILFLAGLLTVILFILWLFVFKSFLFFANIEAENLRIIKNNLILPTAFTLLSVVILVLISTTENNLKKIATAILMVIVVAELFRFGWKFTPFTKENWLFPDTKILTYLKDNAGYYRLMSTDRRIMPPNFSIYYRLYDTAGYDPLYLKNYGQLAAAWERNKSDISPASFNRIITPINYESFITDLLGIKYILSFGPIKSPNLDYVLHEGNSYLYFNKKVFPRTFLAESVVKVKNLQEMINKMFDLGENLKVVAVSTDNIVVNPQKLQNNENAEIISYTLDKISVQVSTDTARILVLTDIYYPTWKAFVDGKETKIYQVDFVFRGVLVPAGVHKIEFKDSLL